MAMYEGAQTVVRTTGDSKVFNVKVGSVLSPLLFVIVMEMISRELRAGLPLELLYAGRSVDNGYTYLVCLPCRFFPATSAVVHSSISDDRGNMRLSPGLHQLSTRLL